MRNALERLIGILLIWLAVIEVAYSRVGRWRSDERCLERRLRLLLRTIVTLESLKGRDLSALEKDDEVDNLLTIIKSNVYAGSLDFPTRKFIWPFKPWRPWRFLWTPSWGTTAAPPTRPPYQGSIEFGIFAGWGPYGPVITGGFGANFGRDKKPPHQDATTTQQPVPPPVPTWTYPPTPSRPPTTPVDGPSAIGFADASSSAPPATGHSTPLDAITYFYESTTIYYWYPSTTPSTIGWQPETTTNHIWYPTTTPVTVAWQPETTTNHIWYPTTSPVTVAWQPGTTTAHIWYPTTLPNNGNWQPPTSTNQPWYPSPSAVTVGWQPPISTNQPWYPSPSAVTGGWQPPISTNQPWYSTTPPNNGNWQPPINTNQPWYPTQSPVTVGWQPGTTTVHNWYPTPPPNNLGQQPGTSANGLWYQNVPHSRNFGSGKMNGPIDSFRLTTVRNSGPKAKNASSGNRQLKVPKVSADRPIVNARPNRNRPSKLSPTTNRIGNIANKHHNDDRPKKSRTQQITRSMLHESAEFAEIRK